jgi:hypothetical protein
VSFGKRRTGKMLAAMRQLSLTASPPCASPVHRQAAASKPLNLRRHVNHQAMFIVTSAGVIATDPIAYGRPTGGQTYVEEIK